MKELTEAVLKRVTRARWLNTRPGYEAHFARMRKRRFLPDVPEDEITLADPPLTLRLDLPRSRVLYIQPDRHFFSDYGSMPKIVQVLGGYDRRAYPYSYLLHDSCRRHCIVYAGGRVRYGTNTLRPYGVNHRAGNRLLLLGLWAEGCPRIRRYIIYESVCIFGPRWQARK